jgi:hypothetical protein
MPTSATFPVDKSSPLQTARRPNEVDALQSPDSDSSGIESGSEQLADRNGSHNAARGTKRKRPVMVSYVLRLLCSFRFILQPCRLSTITFL